MTDKLKISREAILELAEILKESDLAEIEYETEQGRIRVVRHVKNEIKTMVSLPTAQQSPPQIGQQTKETGSSPDVLSHPGTIKSPMVGMVYLAPEPNAAPFVKIGDKVSQGQTLLIIESMKVMNPIKSSKGGTVLNILVNDATPVEFNEPLLVIG
jgi:acetyl-CoA carboxylase biotin carboxyl carrier protein